MRVFSLAALVTAAALGQIAKTPPSFEAASVQVSAPVRNAHLRGPFIRNGRYELRNATMVDLIALAYGVDNDNVFGGPTWLEMDRYDVVAKLRPGSDQESQKAMLKALLGDRFKLANHNGNAPVAAYALTVAKPGLLKKSNGTGDGFCRIEPQYRPGKPGSPSAIEKCTNITVTKFAEELPLSGFAVMYLDQHIVIDQTELEGAWDFNFRYTFRMLPGDGETVTFFDALEKQLGLKLKFTKVVLPVIVVDNVNEEPTDDLPNIKEILKIPARPRDFEVAVVKPSTPGEREEFRIHAGGHISVGGMPLRELIRLAWNLPDDLIFGAPKWIDDARFDITAKAAADRPSDAMAVDTDAVRLMLRNLLQERFKMKTHADDRLVNAYKLVAVKPKLKKAEPGSRTCYKEGPSPDGKDPRNKNPLAPRLVTVQNMTMAQFAEKLPVIASDYVHSPVVDATGLGGSWDFTLSFSPAGMDQFVNRDGRGGETPGEVLQASAPSGVIPLPQALEKQLGLKLETVKRMAPVLVIDHIEAKPIEN